VIVLFLAYGDRMHSPNIKIVNALIKFFRHTCRPSGKHLTTVSRPPPDFIIPFVCRHRWELLSLDGDLVAVETNSFLQCCVL
jgi:hypothetical protein